MALTFDFHPPHHIPLLIGCEQSTIAHEWCLDVSLWNFGEVGRRERLSSVFMACHTGQLACLRAPSSMAMWAHCAEMLRKECMELSCRLL